MDHSAWGHGLVCMRGRTAENEGSERGEKHGGEERSDGCSDPLSKQRCVAFVYSVQGIPRVHHRVRGLFVSTMLIRLWLSMFPLRVAINELLTKVCYDIRPMTASSHLSSKPCM